MRFCWLCKSPVVNHVAEVGFVKNEKPTADATEDCQMWPIRFGWVSVVGGAMTLNSPSEKMKSSWWDADSVWTCLPCWPICKQLVCCLCGIMTDLSTRGLAQMGLTRLSNQLFEKKNSLFLYLTPSQWLWFALVGVSTQSLGPWKVKSQEIQKTGLRETPLLCVENTALKLQSEEISYKQMEIMIGWRSKTKL